MKRILLYSTGLDSWLIDKLWKPTERIFFKTQTKSNDVEYEKLNRQMQKGLVSHIRVVDYKLNQFELPEVNYYLPLRNLHFVLMASHYADEETEICLGSVKGSVHKDNNTNFATLSSILINYLFSEQGKQHIKVVVPYEHTSKKELLRMYLEQGGDAEKAWNESFSCYKPHKDEECFTCTSCLSKAAAFYFNCYDVVSIVGKEKLIEAVENNLNRVEEDVLVMYKELKDDN